MTFWSHLFDSNYRQRSDINSLQSRMRSARRQASWQERTTKDRIDTLEQQVGELALLCRSMFTALRRTGVLDTDQFEKALQEIDAEDGAVDGLATPDSGK